MSKPDLEIFNYLDKYLTQANDSCGTAGMDVCSKSGKDAEPFEKYYLSRHALNNPDPNLLGDGVTLEFVNRVRAWANNLSKYDTLTTRGSIIDAIDDGIAEWVDATKNTFMVDAKPVVSSSSLPASASASAAPPKIVNLEVFDKDDKLYKLSRDSIDAIKTKTDKVIGTSSIDSSDKKDAVKLVLDKLLAEMRIPLEDGMSEANAVVRFNQTLDRTLKEFKTREFVSPFNRSPQVQKLLQRLKAGTDNYTESDGKLFNTYFQVINKDNQTLGQGDWENKIDPTSDRINAKKVETGTGTGSGLNREDFLIYKLLPDVKDKRVKTGEDKYETGTDSTMLEIARAAYQAKDFKVAPGLKLEERVNDKKHLIEEIAKLSRNIEIKPLDYEEDIVGTLERNGWERNLDGVFKKRNPNGTYTTYDPNSDAIDKYITRADKCYTFQVGETNSLTDPNCEKFMQAVVYEKNPNKILALVTDGKFKFSKSMDEIKNIFPVLALQTLKVLGFKTKWDGKKFIIPNVNVWVERFAKKNLNAESLETLSNKKVSENLIGYLSLLIQYVNANPSLLNKGTDINLDESGAIEAPTDEFFKSFRRAGSRERNGNNNKNAMNLIEALKGNQGGYNKFFRYDPTKDLPAEFGYNPTPNAELPLLAQFMKVGSKSPLLGGGGGDGDEPLGVMGPLQTQIRSQNASDIFLAIKKLLATLKQKGLPFSKEDNEKLNNKINNYGKEELEILEIIQKLAKLNKLKNMIDIEPHAFNMKELDYYSSKYNKLLDKRDKSQFSWIQLKSLLQDLVDNDNNKNQDGDYRDFEIDLPAMK